VILVDSSAWIEYLRATGSPVHHRVRTALEDGEQLATVGAVVLELLAGSRDERHAAQLARLIDHCTQVSTEDPVDYETAAAVYRECRRAGKTPRALLDCLIAAIAIRTDMPLLQSDRDFETIASRTALRLLAR
jgi:predicted nucleic acid-binding protein